MISIILIAFVAQAEYLMTMDNEYMNIYLLDKCYYTGGNTYTKYVREDKKAKGYTSTTGCGDWHDDGSFDLKNGQSFVDNLPEYLVVDYAYIDAKDCKIKESEARPIETLIKSGCIKTSETTSTKTEIKDGKFIKNDYDASNSCTGTPSNIINKDMDKCFTDKDGFYHTAKDSAVTLSAIMAFVLALLL
ncbi:hypothetical protein EIN_075720 [Entamoeba invadens IP1]|uniref:Uncharacterized protein n=1 Tax=Entamoeba invadens IP1 TaxID=370355 RepID=A0A0A1TW79_ENTIV|nr:hypothetical protein EIN_075720 [Entamoeba invadens IP1]ELP84783.1 hypothetical protein EIN_075720 [Entamoeba invadens IP1]|eukprot:XP_004184129.1 hypothetical protein EIN_075720 [Entamoeba invadens IP1]